MLGCQKNENKDYQSNAQDKENEIKELKVKISKIEQLIKTEVHSQEDMNEKVNGSPIKSVTFRIGSSDDRLRIYWQDGSKTDLPCTKEQSIWACG